jgi:hypothetical protein
VKLPLVDDRKTWAKIAHNDTCGSGKRDKHFHRQFS